MSLRDELARVAVRDARYTIDAYEFAFATIDHARRLRMRRAEGNRARGRRSRKAPAVRHISGQDLCLAAKDLALELYGRMALTVLEGWGLRSTTDLGNVVYNLIENGDLEKNDRDQRSDFDNVFDFDGELCNGFELVLDELE
jgi:uncharacterized repeat protein (TIGR04138 family)